MRLIRGVIFDLDGVLVSTDELHYRSWKMVADAEGIHFDRTINERLRGVDRTTSLAIILERARRSYGEDEKKAMAERKNSEFREMVSAMTAADLLPGAMSLLESLRSRGLKTAVASSSRNAGLIVEQLGLSNMFDAVVDGNHITRSKPDPEVFLKAAAALALPPRECVVVEDAESGIEAARRAGMPVLGVSRGSPLAGATRVTDSLANVTADSIERMG